MIAAAAMVLLAVNTGVWMAAQKGVIEPIGNISLWGAFVVLNMVSILWATSLLGLQPLVVAISYVAGGCLAFIGVKGESGIRVAEVVTAGAVYGAFGALAICNATTKVRLAFFNKGQVPFIFIIVVLLVLDAVLNSGVSRASVPVILNAVVLPFAVAGVVIGLAWTMISRAMFSKMKGKAVTEAETLSVPSSAIAEPKEATGASAPVKIKAPERIVVKEEPEVTLTAAREAAPPKPPEPTVVKEPAKAVEAKLEKEEEFFPLEIDKGEEVVPPKAESGLAETMAELGSEVEEKEEPFSISAVDSKLYASGADEEVHKEAEAQQPAVEPEGETLEEPAAEEKPPAAPEKKDEEKKESKSHDWLHNHMELLKKLK